MSNVQQQKKMVEQLRVEYSVNRIPMSQSIKDLVDYTENKKDEDHLIIGVDKKLNPYMEKGGCSIL